MGVVLDVRDRNRWLEVKDEVEKKMGYVSILVNNAGIMDTPGFLMSQRGLVDYGWDNWERMSRITLDGLLNGIFTFGPGIRDRGDGHIVNTSSTQGLIPTRGVAAYSACKHAIVGLSEALRAELDENNVGVSILFPGVTSTRLAANELKRIGMEIPGFKMPGMDPEQTGEFVAEGIKNNKPYIITHGEYEKAYRDRIQGYYAAFAETPISKEYDPTKPLEGTPDWVRSEVEKEKQAKLKAK